VHRKLNESDVDCIEIVGISQHFTNLPETLHQVQDISLPLDRRWVDISSLDQLGIPKLFRVVKHLGRTNSDPKGVVRLDGWKFEIDGIINNYNIIIIIQFLDHHST